jgi:hypothetical protein
MNEFLHVYGFLNQDMPHWAIKLDGRDLYMISDMVKPMSYIEKNSTRVVRVTREEILEQI